MASQFPSYDIFLESNLLTINGWSAAELQKLHEFIGDNEIVVPRLEKLSLTCSDDLTRFGLCLRQRFGK